MIRNCIDTEVTRILEIINKAAVAYQDAIPSDCFHLPYMNLDELLKEINSGVIFWAWEEAGIIVGVMGIQQSKDAMLIRHAYVDPAYQGKGIGSNLLSFLLKQSVGTILVGTWSAAHWAIRLYQRHGFNLVSEVEKNQLLDTYWTISPRQQEVSVVLCQKKMI